MLLKNVQDTLVIFLKTSLKVYIVEKHFLYAVLKQFHLKKLQKTFEISTQPLWNLFS